MYRNFRLPDWGVGPQSWVKLLCGLWSLVVDSANVSAFNTQAVRLAERNLGRKHRELTPFRRSVVSRALGIKRY